MSQRRAETQASKLSARRHSQQLQSPPPQSTSPSQSIPLTENRETSSSYLKISSILNGHASATTSAQQIPSGTIPTAERCAERLSQVSRGNSVSKSPSRVTSIQRIANQGDINARFFVSQESGQTYMAEQRSFDSSERPQLPTPPVQSHEQQYDSPSTSWPAKYHRNSDEGAMQASAKIPLSQNESSSISVSLHNPPSSQKSPAPVLYGNIKQPPQTDVVPIQESLDAALIQSQQSPFRSSSACSFRQTSASEPVPVLTMTTSDGLYVVPVDIHQGSRLADEKRARNAGASARFRQRRKEKEKENSTTIEKLQQQTRKLESETRNMELERDFYRGERDRFRDIVSMTPGLKHLASLGPPSPRSMRSALSQGLMPQMADPQAPPQAEFHANPRSEQAPKRRRKNTQSGYFSAEQLPPVTTHSPVLLGFPPRPTLPPQTTAPTILFPAMTRPHSYHAHIVGQSRSYDLETVGVAKKNHHTHLFGPLDETQHISHSSTHTYTMQLSSH